MLICYQCKYLKKIDIFLNFFLSMLALSVLYIFKKECLSREFTFSDYHYFEKVSNPNQQVNHQVLGKHLQLSAHAIKCSGTNTGMND